MLNIAEPYRVPRPRMDEYGNYEIPRTYIKTAVRYVHQILHDKMTGPEVAKRPHLGGIYAFMLGSNLYLITNFNENKVLEITEELRVKDDEDFDYIRNKIVTDYSKAGWQVSWDMEHYPDGTAYYTLKIAR